MFAFAADFEGLDLFVLIGNAGFHASFCLLFPPVFSGRLYRKAGGGPNVLPLLVAQCELLFKPAGQSVDFSKTVQVECIIKQILSVQIDRYRTEKAVFAS